MRTFFEGKVLAGDKSDSRAILKDRIERPKVLFGVDPYNIENKTYRLYTADKGITLADARRIAEGYSKLISYGLFARC